MTKIATFAMQKGGAGKSTLVYNFSEYLSVLKKKKVLLIDLDYQGSVSETYGFYDPDKSSVGLFTNEEVEIRHIHDNLDLIPANFVLEELPLELRAKGVQNVHFILQDWLIEREKQILEYDYVLFDTHPDTLTVTLNTIATSDYQIAVVEPSQFGYNAVPKTIGSLEKLKADTYDRRRKEETVSSEVLFVLNKLVEKEDLTQELLKSVEEDNLKITARFNYHTHWGKSVSKNIPIFNQDLKKMYKKPILENFENLQRAIEK